MALLSGSLYPHAITENPHLSKPARSIYLSRLIYPMALIVAS